MTAGRPILICFDGSDAAAQAIAVAGELFPGRRAVIAHVWAQPMMSGGFAGGFTYAVPADVQAQAEEHAARHAEQVAQSGAALARQAGLHPEERAGQSSTGVWPVLLSLADDADASVIVAGSRGLGGVRSLLLGSVSNGLVHHANRPVLIVRHGHEPGHSSA